MRLTAKQRRELTDRIREHGARRVAKELEVDERTLLRAVTGAACQHKSTLRAIASQLEAAK